MTLLPVGVKVHLAFGYTENRLRKHSQDLDITARQIHRRPDSPDAGTE